MNILKEELGSDGLCYYTLFCPGCEDYHVFDNTWDFNGDFDKPTVSPSLLLTYNGVDKSARCHSFIRNGNIEFLSDCSHKLAGQTMPMVELLLTQ